MLACVSMSAKFGGMGWLLAGAVATAIVWLGLGASAGGAVDAFLPAGWRRFGLGILVFGTFCAIYFRSHWAATLGLLQTRGPGSDRAARRLRAAAADLERSLHVIGDNLAEVGDVPDATAQLYLDGARAHTNKMADVATRVRGVAEELTRHGIE